MKSIWTQHLPDQKARDEFKQVLKNSTQLKDRLLQILHGMYENVERKGFKEEDYADAGWTFLQAFRNGKIATLREVADLFDFEEKDKA